MTTWYTVSYGFITLETVFNTYEEAELMALAMSAVSCERWHADLVIGWDC